MAGAQDKSRDPRPDQAGSFTRRASVWLADNRGHWVRALLMVLFYIVLSVVRVIVGLAALFQVASLLLTGRPNDPLRRFGAGLARYTADLVAYLTCADDHPPFPFSPWPGWGNDESPNG